MTKKKAGKLGAAKKMKKVEVSSFERDYILEQAYFEYLLENAKCYLKNLKANGSSKLEIKKCEKDIEALNDTALAIAFESYTDENSPEYEPIFCKEIRDLRPDWFE